MKIGPIEVVIHNGYGGFHIDSEMALWLMENRGWRIGKPGEDVDLIEGSKDWFYSDKFKTDSFEFRTNKDLIDCIKSLKLIHKNDKYPECYYGHIHKLSIVEVNIELGIENYNDGYEKVTVFS